MNHSVAGAVFLGLIGLDGCASPKVTEAFLQVGAYSSVSKGKNEAVVMNEIQGFASRKIEVSDRHMMDDAKASSDLSIFNNQKSSKCIGHVYSQCATSSGPYSSCYGNGKIEIKIAAKRPARYMLAFTSKRMGSSLLSVSLTRNTGRAKSLHPISDFSRVDREETSQRIIDGKLFLGDQYLTVSAQSIGSVAITDLEFELMLLPN